MISDDQAPLFFADLNEPRLALDEPAPFTAGQARQRFTARLLGEYGTVAHLNGQGGDEVLPPWVTDDAAELVRTAILTAEPTVIADDPVTHAAVARIRASAYRAALYRDAMQANGIFTAMPFFDRHVVEACLSVLPWERTDPWCPKPLLRSAFLGVIPGTALSRRTKGAYNADIYHGWNTHRLQIAELLDRPQLVEQGLVDHTRLRGLLASFGPSRLPPAWITDLIAVESWLRDLGPPFTPEEASNAVASADPTPSGRDQARPCRGDRAR